MSFILVHLDLLSLDKTFIYNKIETKTFAYIILRLKNFFKNYIASIFNLIEKQVSLLRMFVQEQFYIVWVFTPRQCDV